MAGPRIFDTLTLDGAPREAPAAFAQPKAEPLAAPGREPGVEVSGALARPDSIRSPDDPGPTLESLAPAVQAPRDPHKPFESTSLLATSGPRAHDPRTPFELSSGPASSTQFAPPDASSLVVAAAPQQGADRAPQAQLPASGPAPQTVNNYPLGGSWSGAPAPRPQETPDELTGPLVLLTDTGVLPYSVGNLLRTTGLGMLGCLAIGFIIQPFALAMLLLAWILSMTQSRSRRFLRAAFLVALGIVALVILVTLLAGQAQPLPVGNSVARWVCLAMILAGPRLTRSDLARAGRLVTAKQAQTMGWAPAAGPRSGTGRPQPPAAGAVPPGPPVHTAPPAAPPPGRADVPPGPVPGPPMHTAPPAASRPGEPGAPQPPYPGYPGRQGPNW